MFSRLLGLALLVPVLSAAAYAAGPDLAGRVVDENGAPVSGARVALQAPGSAVSHEADSDTAGRFIITGIQPGTYLLRASKAGFYAFIARNFTLRTTNAPVEIVINHQQEFEETVNVDYSAPTVDHQETAVQTTLKSDEFVDIPFPASHDFRNALPLIPGIIRDNQGRIHLNGGAESQAHYSLDGFNITNPVSSILDNRISIDAIRSVRVEGSRSSAEYGKGSAGVMALETGRGDDRYRYSATNFFPSFENHDRIGISNWNPRATVSGPIVRGRAWFFNALDLQYDRNIIDQLPRGANQNRNWSGSNRTLVQVNLTGTNLLTAGFLGNFHEARRAGLNPLNPLETTRDRRERFYFVSLKDQAYFGGGWVLETGLARNTLYSHDWPQGTAPYKISPSGRSGNYFMRSTSKVERLQMLVNALTPYWTWNGRHSFKVGLDANLIRFSRGVERSPVEILRQSGALSRRASFLGSLGLGRDSSEFSFYGQDRYIPRDGLLIEAGLRMDWDQILRTLTASPRLAVNVSPRRLRGAKFSGGVGVFYDAMNLGILTRELDQERVDEFYGEDGTTVVHGPVFSRFVAGDRTLTAPFSINWSFGWEQELPKSFNFRLSYMYKHGRNGWAFRPEGEPPHTELYRLESTWSHRYAALEATVSGTFLDKHPWFLSYTRSRARSQAVMDFSVENFTAGTQSPGPVDWDSPNRLVSWAFLPLPYLKKYSLSYLLEWHSGFPYSVVDDVQRRVGLANTSRFPDYFSLNLHIERRFRFWRFQWALRAGFNNITDSRNPVVVNNNVMSPQFRAFSGGQGRVFTSRIRFIGRS